MACRSPGWDPVGVFERFTDRARRVLVLAQEEARVLNHGFIGTEHILLGLMDEGEGVGAKALEQLEVSVDDARRMVEEIVGASGNPPTGSPPFTPRAKKVLELSLREALQLGHNYIGTEHILLGLLREGEGVAAQVLVSLGLDLDRVRQEVVQLLSGYQSPAVLEPGWSGRRRGELVACSFCGRRPPDSGRLVSGRAGVFICELCLTELSGRLHGEEDDREDPEEIRREPVVILARSPADVQTAVREVSFAFHDAFILSEDRKTVPSVEGGELLGPCLKEAQERHADLRRKDQSITVEDIEFLDDGHAVVMFTVSLAGRPSMTLRGDAVVVDGHWLMARATFCELMTLAGVECPPG